jgi:uncharacterized protein (DUF983 family)
MSGPTSPHPVAGLTSRFLAAVWAALRERCPRCHTGRMFRNAFTMNDPCPVCGLVFQREEGYFLGAMYASYVLSAVILLPLYFGLAALLPDWNGMLVTLLAMLLYLPFVPAVFRYSRVAWVYADRAVCPGNVSAGPYEKFREKQLAERAPEAGGPQPPGPPGLSH